jgi:hypothetical protein
MNNLNKLFEDFLANGQTQLARLTEDQFWNLALSLIPDQEKDFPKNMRSIFRLGLKRGFSLEDLGISARKGSIMSQVLMATLILACPQSAIVALPIVYKLLEKGLDAGDVKAEMTAELANDFFATIGEEFSEKMLSTLTEVIDAIIIVEEDPTLAKAIN